MAIKTWLAEHKAKAKRKKIPVHTNGVLGRRVSGKLPADVEAAAAVSRRAFLERKVDPDGAVRRGRVFTLRLQANDETELRKLKAEHEKQLGFSNYNAYGFDTRAGLGSFIVWAALQFKPAARR